MAIKFQNSFVIFTIDTQVCRCRFEIREKQTISFEANLKSSANLEFYLWFSANVKTYRITLLSEGVKK